MKDSSLFERAIAAFDEANAADPTCEEVDGKQVPHEWIDAKRVSAWVEKLQPNASEPLRLASRCQHIRRWERPRDDYPKTRVGYLNWRQDLKKFHAEVAAEILEGVGYDADTIQAVRDLNLKKNLKQGGDVQVLEDALCLTFLEFEFASFLDRVPPERMIGILQKSWGKMSEQARNQALKLPFSEQGKALIEQALAGD